MNRTAALASDVELTRFVSRQGPNAKDEDARAFLQERLAYLGKVYAAIGIGFFVAGNLADFASGPGYLARRSGDLHTWVVPTACAMYLAQWAVCRKGSLPLPVLRSIDAATTTLTATFHSFMVFSTNPSELPGLSYARGLLLFTFGLLIRAIVVPSSAGRTLILGLLATCPPVVSSQIWYLSQPISTSSAMHAIWTTQWCLGAVVIATLASHVIFGLRQQVREAWQLGQYTLLEKIGEGGMGSVYRASHAMLRRPTAVKLLAAEHAGAQRLERFEREVQLTSRLTHPNTVAIFDYGKTPDGIFYYAMEYLDGVNLEDLVRLDGPQSPGRVAHILTQVASSLAEAHGVGLIHRDIKPGNVILVAQRGGSADVAKVVDFGLVKELDRDAEITGEGNFAGTPHYLAPETVSAPEDVGPGSDLYSLGCVGYYLLTGKTVFDGRTVVEVCSHHLHSQPLPPEERIGRDLPDSLSAIVMACLRKEPEQRPRSAEALVALLHSCDDVVPWTNAMAHQWWDVDGSRALAAVREQREAIADSLEPTPLVPGLSLKRPWGFRPLRRGEQS